MSVESERQRRVLGLLIEMGSLSVVEIAREVRFSLKKAANAATMLLMRGYVERSVEGPYRATELGVAFHASGAKLRSGPVKPRGLMNVSRDTLRQRAWTGMRLHGRFTIDDLVMVASRPTDANPHAALQKYLSALCKAEMVVRLPRRAGRSAPTSPGAVVYRLVNDTGERCPTISRQGAVVDRNVSEGRRGPR